MSDPEKKSYPLNDPEFQANFMAQLGPFAAILENAPIEEFLDGLDGTESEEYIAKHWRKSFLGIHRGKDFHRPLKAAWVRYLLALKGLQPIARHLVNEAVKAEAAVNETAKKGDRRIIMPPDTTGS